MAEDHPRDRLRSEADADGASARRPADFAAAAGPGRLAHRLDRLALAAGATLEREFDAGRGFLFLPVAFASGILAYVALPGEPQFAALAVLLAVLSLAAWRLRSGGAGPFRLLLVAALAAGGAVAMKARTDRVAAPVLERQVTVTLAGWVEARDARRGGYRLTIRVHSMDGARIAALPKRVNVTVRGAAPATGDGVRVLARLRPSSGPVLPGGYDFGRNVFYQGVGATGFAYGRATAVDIGPAPLSVRLLAPVETLREGIRERILAVLPGDVGRVASALIIGDAGGISEKAEDDMRQSGLAHVLSVSGLHMALVAGAVFWSLRALLALVPGLALRRPIKKWAALGAIVMTGFYLLISGLDVAAQRSFVMTATLFTAILLDRRAIAMRNVAIAALIVLAIAPESLLAAGFQMSFAATIALVAGFEFLAAYRRGRPRGLAEPSWLTTTTRWFAALIGGLALTSFLGGMGTTPFALYHFQRMAPLSILANVAAMPLIDFLVMPLALLSTLAMPFGLEAPLLELMGLGIEGMLYIAGVVTEWSRGTGGAAMPSAASLLIFVAGFLWLALMGERWRLLGLAPMLVGGVLALLPARPDVLVAADGRQIAIRAENGGYRIVARKADPFVTAIWLRSDGDARDAEDPLLLEGGTCDGAGCLSHVPGIGLAALVLDRSAFEEDCRRTALVVTPMVAPAVCAGSGLDGTGPLVLDRAVLRRSGALALFAKDDGRTRAPAAAELQDGNGASDRASTGQAGGIVASNEAAETAEPVSAGSNRTSRHGPRSPDAGPSQSWQRTGDNWEETAETAETLAGRRTLRDEDMPSGTSSSASSDVLSAFPASPYFEIDAAFPAIRRPFMPPVPSR